jgi:hypothetical protein
MLKAKEKEMQAKKVIKLERVIQDKEDNRPFPEIRVTVERECVPQIFTPATFRHAVQQGAYTLTLEQDEELRYIEDIAADYYYHNSAHYREKNPAPPRLTRTAVYVIVLDYSHGKSVFRDEFYLSYEAAKAALESLPEPKGFRITTLTKGTLPKPSTEHYTDEQLLAYLQTHPVYNHTLEQHLRECSDCRARYDSYRY